MNLELECRHCGHMIVLDPEQQTKILAELRLPAQVHIVECGCGRYAFALVAAPMRLRAVCR
jgi:hypothetical protein